MAKFSSRNLTARANAGATCRFRDETRPRQIDEALKGTPEFGQHPLLMGIDGEPSTISFYGLDSDVARRMQFIARAEFQSALIAAQAAGEKIDHISADDLEREDAANFDLVCALAFAWRGWEDDDDVPILFSPDKVRELFTNDRALYLQALAFLRERDRFFASPASGSSTPSLKLSGSKPVGRTAARRKKSS